MSTLERNWWAVGLRGLIAVLFGLVAIARPSTSLLVLITLLGVWWLVDGVFAIVSAVRAAEERLRWWPLLIEGITGIVLGIAVFALPGLTTFVILMFVAAWFVIVGAFRIVAAVSLRREIEGEWLMIASGVVSVALGLLLFAFPRQGALAFMVIIGLFALVGGAVLLVLAGRLYGFSRWHRTHPAV